MSRKQAEALKIAEGLKNPEWENWSDALDREEEWWEYQDMKAEQEKSRGEE